MSVLVKELGVPGWKAKGIIRNTRAKGYGRIA